MPVTALVGYTVFLTLAFGLRAALHYRHTGTTGYVGVSGRPFSTDWCAGVLFGVAVVGGVLAPMAELLGLVRSWTGAADGTTNVARAGWALGLAFTAFGIVGTLWAQFAMGTSWRIGVDQHVRTELVSRGPFRWVRNPIFTWMTFASLGLGLLAPNLLSVASLLALLLALEIQVRAVEEPYLLRTHGEAYRRYAATTGRFLPGIGRLG